LNQEKSFQKMPNILILSSSVRLGRNSHRLALFFRQYLLENQLAQAEILDLNEYQFPIFEERLMYQTNPDPRVLEFAGKIKAADGVIIVTPEYNGGYPASLKNAIDVLEPEWYKKPVALVTASDGQFGGSQVITALLLTFWKLGAVVVPARYPVPKVQEAYGPDGSPTDPATTNKFAKKFIKELLWTVKAVKAGMKETSPGA